MAEAVWAVAKVQHGTHGGNRFPYLCSIFEHWLLRRHTKPNNWPICIAVDFFLNITSSTRLKKIKRQGLFEWIFFQHFVNFRPDVYKLRLGVTYSAYYTKENFASFLEAAASSGDTTICDFPFYGYWKI